MANIFLFFFVGWLYTEDILYIVPFSMRVWRFFLLWFSFFEYIFSLYIYTYWGTVWYIYMVYIWEKLNGRSYRKDIIHIYIFDIYTLYIYFFANIKYTLLLLYSDREKVKYKIYTIITWKYIFIYMYVGLCIYIYNTNK